MTQWKINNNAQWVSDNDAQWSLSSSSSSSVSSSSSSISCGLVVLGDVVLKFSSSSSSVSSSSSSVSSSSSSTIPVVCDFTRRELEFCCSFVYMENCSFPPGVSASANLWQVRESGQVLASLENEDEFYYAWPYSGTFTVSLWLSASDGATDTKSRNYNVSPSDCICDGGSGEGIGGGGGKSKPQVEVLMVSKWDDSGCNIMVELVSSSSSSSSFPFYEDLYKYKRSDI